MRLARTMRLIDGGINRIVLPLEAGGFLGPHAADDLAGCGKGAHAVASFRKAIAIGPPFMLIPASAQPKIEPPMAHHIHGGGHFSQQRGVAIDWKSTRLNSSHIP